MKEHGMDAQTVIESYVRDVTGGLARRDRADVALELQALLSEELVGRAEEAGRPADAAMASELLASFGPPDQVAQRYRPANPLIDPADTRPFLTAAVVGSVALGLLFALGQPHAPRSAVSVAILTWLGLLFLIFAVRAWTRRRWAGLVAWKARDPDRVSRFANLALIGVILMGIVAYGAPTWVYAQFTGRTPPPPGLARLAYAPDFQALRLPWLLALWAGQALLIGWVTVAGQWGRLTRRVEAGLALGVTIALVWFLIAGPVFQTPDVDHIARTWLVVIALGLFADAWVKLSRIIHRPPPDARRDPSTLPA